jgi:predicted DNA-binding protein with PD1-like motif
MFKSLYLYVLLLLIATQGSSQVLKSNSTIHVFRLKPHEDLKQSIMDFAAKHHIRAGIIVTCVGSLEQFNLRFANQSKGQSQKGYFEIVSMTGTFNESSMHLHLSVSDEAGKTIGGHLLENNLIYTTAEIAIAELNDVEFDRETDPVYGYKELVIRKKQ